jgi:hypothetical protein
MRLVKPSSGTAAAADFTSIAPFVKKLGHDHSISISGHAECAKCGRKNVEVRVQAPAAGVRQVQG